ncbi:MATH and LRR domain-containing protein PFE0570w-like isoform X2 [Linepithema humile]
MHVENIVLNKRILNKIEYKIRDLELKVNVLTYKVQYGTWPLPHQIYNLHPKKLQKIRMTLSNPGDRKNWIKHVLLSPAESNMCTLYSNTFTPKAKLPKFFDIKQQHIPHRLQCNKLSTDCSSIEISKSISDQSVKMCSRRPRDPRPQNVNTKGSDSLANSEDFTLQHQDMKVLPLVPDEINHQSLKIPSRQSGKCAMHSTSAKYSSCQKLTDNVYKCKSFFKNLKYKNNSRKTSEALSLKTTRAKELASLTTERRNKSSNGRAIVKKKKTNDRKYVTKIIDKYNKDTSADVTSNEGAFPRKLVPIFPIIQAAHIVRSSRETLYKVRKRLHSLHDILETYQHMTQSVKRQESINQISEISDASTSVGPKIYGIKEVDENKTNTNRNSDSKESLQQVQSCRSITNSCEDFEFDRLEGSLSSFEYSSNTSKTCRYSSDVTSQNTYSKRFSQRNTRQKSVDTSDLPVLIAEPYDYNRYSRFYRAMSQIPKDKTEREANTRKYISNRNNNHELESRPKVNKDTIKTNILFNFEEKAPEVTSKKICYVLSSESLKDKNTKTQNKTFLTKKFDTDQLSDTFDAKQSEENISQNSSRSKILNNSDAKEKSTGLLLQEALHFKKILLTQSRKKCPVNSMKQVDVADELPECETRIKNNFPSMILDIKAEEPVADYSHNRINQCYISLKMKQRRDLFSQSLQKVNTLPHRQNHRRDTEEQNRISKTPSEYFSITDLAIYKNDNIKNNVSLPSTPTYEKIISIAMPNSVENQDKNDTNKSVQRKAVLKNIPDHVNSDSLGENTGVDDIHNNIIDKYLSILKLEDLVLEQVQNIRDHMGTFLQNQNRTISETCRELRCQNESDTFLCSNEQNHIVLYNRPIASPSCNNINRVASFSKDLPDLSINAWLKNDILERSPDTRLRKNPEMFALITPIQNTLSDKNDAQLKRKGTDRSLPIDSKSTPKVAKSETLCSKECITPNTENKQTTVDVNFRKHGKQTQTIENGFSAIFPLGIAEFDEKDYWCDTCRMQAEI